MPYIAIKSFPKDKATKETIVEKMNELFLEYWGCPQEAISISIEETAPEDWQEKVMKAVVEPNKDHMMILSGKKLYQE